MHDALAEAILEAASALRDATGKSAWEYFEGQRLWAELPAQAVFSAGLIEGAAVALRLTPIELLDELRVPQT